MEWSSNWRSNRLYSAIPPLQMTSCKVFDKWPRQQGQAQRGRSGADNILKTWQSVGKCQQPGTHILCICGKWQLASGKCAWKINNHVILSSTYDEKALKQLDAKRQKLISYILKFQFILPRTSARRLQADNTHHSHAPPPTADPRPAASRVCECVLTWLLFLLLLPSCLPGCLPCLVVCVAFLVLVLFSHLSLAFLTLLLAKWGGEGEG